MRAEVFESEKHTHVELLLPADKHPAAASRVAAEIAWLRCGGAPQYYDAWVSRYQGGPPHGADLLACLAAFLGSESVGTADDPAPQVHLDGFVAEHVWHLLLVEDALGRGIPLRVDRPDWSVTDSGGDGLAIYDMAGTLSFRLWESKAHTGEGTVRDVVNGAARQIDSKALRYLARFSKIGQTLEQPALRLFYGRLVEFWRTSDAAAGGGISVSTASEDIADCFGGIGNYWSFANFDQRQGMVVVIQEFSAFDAS
jgi:hypothetical protein